MNNFITLSLIILINYSIVYQFATLISAQLLKTMAEVRKKNTQINRLAFDRRLPNRRLNFKKPQSLGAIKTIAPEQIVLN